MKRIIAIIMLMIITPTYATKMCVVDDTVAIVLDPTVGPSKIEYNGQWKITFPYGTISGVSACLSSNHGRSYGGTVANLTDNGLPVVGGETNGNYCWCRMTHPAVSMWIIDRSYSTCYRSDSSGCSAMCAVYIRDSLRKPLFGSITH